MRNIFKRGTRKSSSKKGQQDIPSEEEQQYQPQYQQQQYVQGHGHIEKNEPIDEQNDSSITDDCKLKIRRSVINFF